MHDKYLIFFMLALPALHGCQDSKQEQGRALLERIEAVDIKAPYATRKATVAALATLELTDRELGRVRELCLKAHQALLETEERQAQARQGLDAVTRGNPRASIPPDRASAIAGALEESNRKLRSAIETFPYCEREVRSLAMRLKR
jgi:hypothetical protein